jgi:hypothetical protein
VLLITLSRRAVLLVSRDYRLGFGVAGCKHHDNTTHLFSFFSSLFLFKKTRNALVFMALCGLHVLVSTIPEAISVFFWNGVYSGTLVNKIVIYK